MVHFSLRCSACKARIKAPAALVGQTRQCPRCHKPFRVQPQPLEDSDPILVVTEYLETDASPPLRKQA